MASLSDLYLPGPVANEIARDRAEIATQYFEVKGTLDHFNRELKQIDPRLRMVRAHDKVAEGSPMKASYYHILLDAPGHPTTVLPLQHDDGSYREPGSWIYPYLEENDMWNDRAMRASRNRQQRIREAEERQRDRERQDRVGEFNERWDSANRTSILVNRSVS